MNQQIITEATNLANDLLSQIYSVEPLGEQEEYMLRKINLKEKGWKFKFDNSKRRFGLCSYTKKTVSLSKELTVLNFENAYDKVKDTILHEIAHALNFEMFGRGQDHHGPIWKRIAKQIGCDAKRCYDHTKVETPISKYVYECASCEREIKRHKKIKRETACGTCCKKFNKGKFSRDYVLTLKVTNF